MEQVETQTNAKRLTPQWTMQLHTQVAQRLFVGSWNRRFGLQQFAASMKRVCDAAQADDPYAHVLTLQVDEQIQKLYAEQQQDIIQLEDVRDQFAQRGVQIVVPENAAPWVKPLRFSTPMAYQAAFLLVDFDYLVRLSLTLKGVGDLKTVKPMALYQAMKKELLQLYALPRQWRVTGVTCADLLQRTAKGLQAEALLGVLPRVLLENFKVNQLALKL